MDGPIWYLKRCDLFGRLSEAEADRLNRRARIRRYPRGELIYAPADAGLAVLVLARGRVKIHDLTPNGRETILAFIEEGEIFGEVAVLDGRPRREFAAAVEPSEVLAIPREDFVGLLEVRADLTLSVTRLVGLRRERVEARLRNTLFLSSRGRLAHLLLELIESHGERNGDGHAIRFPLSHQDLAGLIGVSRETVTLTLGQMEADGLVAVERRRVVVRDLARLRRDADRLPNPPTGLPRTATAPF
ncbi:MAG TPA: Crp/Fnr family transcriptional regulator [Gemmataceae bacterium]|nr:Crp/Fnr family transcriptional regulator [Gemmataceae bacterium]